MRSFICTQSRVALKMFSQFFLYYSSRHLVYIGRYFVYISIVSHLSLKPFFSAPTLPRREFFLEIFFQILVREFLMNGI